MCHVKKPKSGPILWDFLFERKKPGPLGQDRVRGSAIKKIMNSLAYGYSFSGGQQAKSLLLWARILYYHANELQADQLIDLWT
jgi:hypothetical protein